MEDITPAGVFFELLIDYLGTVYRVNVNEAPAGEALRRNAPLVDTVSTPLGYLATTSGSPPNRPGLINGGERNTSLISSRVGAETKIKENTIESVRGFG